MNISAGRAVSEAVRSTLGPAGMDKMLVSADGDVVVTNNGATILSKMDIDHPAAKVVGEVAMAQRKTVGEGSTTGIILAGELLRQGSDLLEQDVHATSLVSGYYQALETVQSEIEQISVPVQDRTMLNYVARATLVGSATGTAADRLSRLVVKAVLSVADAEGVNTGDVLLKAVAGRSVPQSELINGVVIDADRSDEMMPATVREAKVAVVNGSLEPATYETDITVTIKSPTDQEAVRQQERDQIQDDVNQLSTIDPDAVFVSGDISDAVTKHFAQTGTLAVSDVESTTLLRLAQATGAMVTSSIRELKPAALGQAGVVRQLEIGDAKRIVVDETTRTSPVTLLLRGGTDHVITEIKRNCKNAVNTVTAALLTGTVLPGGGATEIELARRLRETAPGLSGREQLAVEAFADALEVIPRTLAENAGRDPIDSLVTLRNRHEHGEAATGLDGITGAITDAIEAGIVEPPQVKHHAIEAAVEAASLLLKIDDVIATGESASSGDSGPVVLPETTELSGTVAEDLSVQTLRAQGDEAVQRWWAEMGEQRQQTESDKTQKALTRSVKAPSWVPPKQRFPLTLS